MPDSPLLRRLIAERQRTKPAPLAPSKLAIPTAPTFGELSGFEKVIDVIQRPLYATASAADAIVKGKNPFSEAMKGFSGQRRTTYSDVLKSTGMRSGMARSVIGFAGDILLDPLTYVGVGPVGKVASITVKGVPKALSAAGLAAKTAATAQKTSQALNVLQRATKAGGAALSEARLSKLFAGVSARSPEVKALAEKLGAGQLRGEEGARLLGEHFGRQAIEKVLTEQAPKLSPRLSGVLKGASRASLEAPRAIKFMGLPVIKTETLGKVIPVGKAVAAAERIPVVGKLVTGTRNLVESSGRFLRSLFSAKTGHAEFDVARSRARDIRHIKDIEAADWWIALKKDLEKAAGNDPKTVKAFQDELAMTIEGIEKEVSTLVHPIEKRLAIERRIKAFEDRLGQLLPKQAKEKALGEALEATLAAKVSGAQERGAIQTLGTKEAGITEEAVKRAASESAQAAQVLKGGDLIAQIKQKFKRIYWTEDPTARRLRNAEELRKSGVPRDMIADPKKVAKLGKGYATSIDEVAEHFGIRSDELIQRIEVAVAARKASGKPSQEAIDRIKAALLEKEFVGEVAARTAAIEKQIADLTAKLLKMEASPQRAKIAAEIDRLNAALAREREELRKLRPTEVMTRERVAYEDAPPAVKAIAGKFRERMEAIFQREQGALTLPPEHRAFYMPHRLKPEVDQAIIKILNQDAGRVLRSDMPGNLKAALRRTQQGGALDVKVDDLVRSGSIDPNKLKAELRRQGIELSATDELVFETDPIVAGLGREMSHNRAVGAAEFADEILASPTFTKAKGNVADAVDLARLKRVVQQHPDHAIFVPSRAYVRFFRTEAEREAMRQGKEPDLFMSLLRKVTGEELDQFAKAGGKEKVEAFVIPVEIAEHLSKAYSAPMQGENVKGFLRYFDAAQGWWKLFGTSVRPAFHVRNAISNLWQNFLAGATNPADYVLAGIIQSEAGRKKVANLGGYTGEQVFELARQHGVLKTGYVGADIGEFVERSLRPTGATPQHGPLKGIPGGGLLYPSGPAARAGIKVGSTIEDNARLANFIDGLKKGMDPQSAALRTKKYLFDYADLSDFEKGVLRRILPFYTFTRKSIPLALETIITQPGKVAVLGKARSEFEKNTGSLDHEYVADWINESFGVPVRKNEKGEYEYFLLKGFIPTVDLAKMDPQEILGMLSPFIKEPAQQWANIDFFKNKPIARYPGEKVEFLGMTMPIQLAHLVRNVVFLNEFDRNFLAPGSSPGKGLGNVFAMRTHAQSPVAQMKRYVLSSQVEAYDLKRAAERARESGHEDVAKGHEARAVLLQARRDQAKAELLKIKPDAYKRRKKKRAAAKPPQSIEALRRRLRERRSLSAAMDQRGKAAGQ